jgi:chloramphenicol 3-O phosphotransferase
LESQVMLLNGSPSAGKSTLAAAVQDVAERPIFHRSLDHFLDGYQTGWRSQDQSLFDKVMTGYVHSLASLVRAGCDVVAEAVIIPERLVLYRAAFADVPVLLVGVHCSLDVAKAREEARTDRMPLELGVPWFETVHHVPYDAEVDTTEDPAPEAVAAGIVHLFDRPPQSRAFGRL